MRWYLLRQFVRYGLAVLMLGLLAAFLVWPVLLTVSGAFASRDETGGVFRYFIGEGLGVLHDPIYQQGLINSLSIALFTTILTIAMTLPLAMLSTKYDFKGKALLTGLLLVPLILPPFVGAIGLQALLGRMGAINTLFIRLGFLSEGSPGIDFLGGELGGRFWSVVVMEALHLYPILYLNLAAALANLDPALDEAALGMGAGRVRRFFKITLPLIMPGIFAGGTIVFIWSFTELGTPLMFDYYTVTPVQIFWGIQEVGTNPRPYALVVVMLVIALALYLFGKVLIGGRSYTMSTKASIASDTKLLHGGKAMLVASVFIGVTLLAVLPHIGVIFSSFAQNGSWYRSILPAHFTTDHYEQALSHPLAMGSIRNSLFYASAAMFLATTGGLCISYLTVRLKIRGSWFLDSMAMMPLAVPGLVMAFGYVAMSLNWPFRGPAPQWLRTWFDAGSWPGVWLHEAPFAGMFDIMGNLPNPVPLLIIAYAVRRLPYVVRAASAGLEQTSGQLEEAALNLGASTMYAIRKVVVPLIAANLIAGAILTFSFAMLEVSDSLILAQKETHYPITKAIFDLFQRLGDGPYIASAMGVWGMALLTVTLVGAGAMMGKKLGAVFRV